MPGLEIVEVDEETAICPDCGNTKPLSEFHRDNARKNGHARLCKPCNVEHVRKWRAADPERARRKRQENRASNYDHIIELERANWWAHRDENLARSTEWQRANPEKRAVITKRYRDGHEDEAREYGKRYNIENREGKKR